MESKDSSAYWPLDGDINVTISLDRDLLLTSPEEIAVWRHAKVEEAGELVKDVNS